MGSGASDGIAGRIEGLEALDGPAEPLKKAAALVSPPGSRFKDVLSGTWLGHPLHPPLTDVVVGSWTSALLLDLVGGEGAEDAADALIGAGILAAIPTAATGLSDWGDLRGGASRIGSVHAIGNSTALVLQALSLAARRRGHRGSGVALSVLGYGAATFSAWLGGHLSFRKGVGVDQTTFDSGPDDWTPVCGEGELGEGKLVAVQADGTDVLLVRTGVTVHAIADRCSHRGCGLHEGELEGETVVCPCHGSTFGLDGSLVKGPATAPQPTFAVRLREGKVEIRRPG